MSSGAPATRVAQVFGHVLNVQQCDTSADAELRFVFRSAGRWATVLQGGRHRREWDNTEAGESWSGRRANPTGFAFTNRAHSYATG